MGRAGLTCPISEIVQMRNLAVLFAAIIKRTTQLNRGMSEATLDRSRNSGFDRILIPE